MTVLSNHTGKQCIHYHHDEDFPELLENIHVKTGWDFRDYKKSSLKRRISLRLSAHNVSSYRDYNSILESDPEEYSRLVSTITVKVSEFFREPEVFDLIRELVIPSFSPEEGLRAWSCGCAHGEEAYSLGIVLANSIGIEKLRNVRIFATDIDEKAVNTARKGLYREDSMQNVSDPVKKASFLKTDIGYELRQDIRHLVRFGTLDIINGFPISKVDLLFCRNMLIYFEKELQKRVLEKLDFSLKPGGLLVLGKSETLPSSFSSRYEEILDRSRVYRRIS